MTSPFGERTINGKTTYHSGIDLVCDNPTVIATDSGKVITSRIVTDRSNRTWEWGNYICIETDDGKHVYYCHLKERAVKVGEYVKTGAGIGVMGNTGYSFGAHLHYEVRQNNIPVDASQYLGIENKIGAAVPIEKGETMTEEKRYNSVLTMPEWARNDIQWLIDNQYLKGSAGGLLNLTYDMMRILVIMSRALQAMKK